MPSIAYIDANGVPQDWLFDDVTFMGHYYTAKGTFNSYKAGYTSGKYYAKQDDWYQWLCYAFGKDVNGNDLSYDGEHIDFTIDGCGSQEKSPPKPCQGISVVRRPGSGHVGKCRLRASGADGLLLL